MRYQRDRLVAARCMALAIVGACILIAILRAVTGNRAKV